MTQQDPTALLQSLLDREAIRDCLFRYCRGIDRRDEAALRSAYWPDGTDQHGSYQGSASGFIDWALEKLAVSPRMVHMIGNILIDLQGDSAHVESYFQAFQQDRDADGKPLETFLAGRYIDRFERREGAWRIAARTVVFDWTRTLPMTEGTDAERFGRRQPNGAHRPSDPVYAPAA